MSIQIDIEKSLGDFHLSVHTQAGDEVLALLGASGCGKSMTLRCIAGIETPDFGKIVVDGVTLFDSSKNINLSPQKRRTGLMFQNYALFPNMTVYQNIRTGTLRDKTITDREGKIREIIDRFGLGGLENHLPSQLSGGQQQRTALARILISDPQILLLDEPFSALDSHLRFQLEQEVRNVIKEFGRSVLLVSHDRDEVYRTADRIAVMDAGKVEVCGTRDEVFDSPQTSTAARLTGVTNIAAAEGLENNRYFVPDWGLTLESSVSMETADHIGIRATEILPGPGENAFKAEVIEIIENPLTCTLLLRPQNGTEGTGSSVPNGTPVPVPPVPDSTPKHAPCVHMEVTKKVWDAIQDHKKLLVHIPKEAVLPLKG